ncbi:MAG: hypothetical protein E7001_01900 [Coriobacteriaceae bacterium]|nr:hypothetical protein [Coriobacteriaceae bacterium]
MLNLLRSDLYRMTRLRGGRGELVGYGIAILVIPLGITAIHFIGILVAGDSGALLDTGDNAYDDLFDHMYLTGHFLPLLISFAMVRLTFAEIDGGYSKTLSSAIKGTGSRLIERIALAGVLAGALTIVAALGALTSGAIVTMGGLSFTALPQMAPWILAIWLTSWVYALPPLVFSLLVRNKTAGYVSTLYASAYPNILLPVLSVLSQVLGTTLPLDAFTALTPFSPGHVVELLGNGAAAVLGPGTGPFAFDGGLMAQVAVVFVIWIAIATVSGLAVAARRRG